MIKRFDIVVKFNQSKYEASLAYRDGSLEPGELQLVQLVLSSVRSTVIEFLNPWEVCTGVSER